MLPILTKPSVSRNQKAQFTLSKADLALLISDPLFQDTDNWSKIELSYGSSTTNQRSIVVFDAQQDPIVSDFFISDKSQGDFLVKKITIHDFDGGYYVVKRDELNTAEFDVVLDQILIALGLLDEDFCKKMFIAYSSNLYELPIKKSEIDFFLEDACSILEIKKKFNTSRINKNFNQTEFQYSQVRFAEKYFEHITNMEQPK
jgi:hypothetical protein